MDNQRDFRQVEWNADLADDCRQLVRLAVREDLERSQDWTTVSLVPPEARGKAEVVARQNGVVCGHSAVLTVLDEMYADVSYIPEVPDGTPVVPGECIATLEGSARDMLTTERTVLNFLGHLSGISTMTRHFVEQVSPYPAKIYDTRKTTPGYRRLEKYATRCGGASNHRGSLSEAILIKDNHLAWWSGSPEMNSSAEGTESRLSDVLVHVRHFLAASHPERSSTCLILEIEVDTLSQLEDVLVGKPDIVLLDNMTLDELRSAVTLRNDLAPGTQLEASGGVTLETVASIAATGVDRISVGALTHSAINFDVGLDWKGSGSGK